MHANSSMMEHGLLTIISKLDVENLKQFPVKYWEEKPSERWVDLCNQLQEYNPPKPSLKIRNHERKWEFVSAYQKSIRRSDKELALWLIGGAITFLPTEWKYIWGRICTTSAEDIGGGDPELMNFVIACSQLYPPTVGPEILYKAWAFLSEKMCGVNKSRIYCTLSCLDLWDIRDKIEPDNLSEWESSFLIQLKEYRSKEHNIWGTPHTLWTLKSNWRSEGMMKYQSYPLDLNLIHSHKEMTPSEKLYGLPDYAFDTHTRVGKIVITRMCGLPSIKSFFETYPIDNKTSAIGDAIFYLEGGLVKDELFDARLDKLEHKFMAKKLGWTLTIWENFMKVIEKEILTKKVNEIRMHVLAQQGY